MTSQDRRQREKQATREKILAAARHLFAENGFASVSMRRIAEEIDYTPAALYVHFKDKDTLVMEMLDEDFGRFTQLMAETNRHTDPVVRLREGGRAYVRFALEHPHHYRLMFMSKLPILDPADCRNEHGNPDEDGYACLRATVADCIHQGRFLPKYRDIETVTQMCWAAAHGVVSLYIAHGEDPWVPWQEPITTAYAALDAMIDGMTGAAGASSEGQATTRAPANARSRVKATASTASAKPRQKRANP